MATFEHLQRRSERFGVELGDRAEFLLRLTVGESLQGNSEFRHVVGKRPPLPLDSFTLLLRFALAMPFNFGSDASVFDGLQTVTVQAPDAEEGFTAQALKRPVTLRELELSNGIYLPGDVRWHFASADLEADPVVGTLIVESGGRTWSVVERDASVFGTRHTCTARYLGDGS